MDLPSGVFLCRSGRLCGADGLYQFIGNLSQVIATDDNIAIEQWTGLTDSKGVDIYEGDILSNEFDEPTIVEWDNTRLRYLLKTKGEVPYIFPDDADLTEDHVIGNIHEK